MIPLQGEWKGTGGSMLLCGRRGQLVNWSPFNISDDGGNYNVCVTGKSGSGKSFFMQEIMMSNVRTGGKAFVIDKGESFKRLCLKCEEGEYLDFSFNSDICINPFSKIPTECDADLIKDALKAIKVIVNTIIAPCNPNLVKTYKKLGSKAVDEIWKEKSNTAGLEDVRAYFASNKCDSDYAKDIALSLHDYGLQGANAKWFNGLSNVDFGSNLIVVELSKLVNDEEFFDVILQMIMMQIYSSIMLSDRSYKTSIIVDEGWKILFNEKTGPFVDEMYRTLRKYEANMVVGTQNLTDFSKNVYTKGILGSSQWKCILKQDHSQITESKKQELIELDAYSEKQLRSIRSWKGKYSEVGIMGEQGLIVCRFVADPYTCILYTTAGSEYQECAKYEKQGLSVDESTLLVCKKRFDESWLEGLKDAS